MGRPWGHHSKKAILATPPPPPISTAALSPPKPGAPGEVAQSQFFWEGFLEEEQVGKEKRNGARAGQGGKAHIWRTDAKASGSWKLVR